LTRSWRAQVVLAAVAMVTLLLVLSSAQPAIANKGCGSFRVPGLLTRVHVTVTRGSVPCHRAKHVMKQLFHGHSTSPWKCVGPQTGYAACHHHRKRIRARF
jgi:hypothetical protein